MDDFNYSGRVTTDTDAGSEQATIGPTGVAIRYSAGAGDDSEPDTADQTPLLVQARSADDHGHRSSHRRTSEISTNKRNVTAVLVGATIAAVIGTSAQFGYGTAMLDNIRPVIVSTFQENTSCSTDYDVDNLALGSSKRSFELATAAFCAGGLVGSLLGGWLVEVLGRKYTMLVNNVIALPSGLIMYFAADFSMLIGGRLVQGVAAGLSMVVVGVYLGEIAPTSVRGAVGTMNQAMIAGCIFVSTALGLPYLLGTCHRWHLLVGGAVVFSIIQVVTLIFSPRSPRFLYIRKGDPVAAEKELRRLRGASCDISSEIAEMMVEKHKQDSMPKLGVIRVLLNRDLRFRFQLTAIIHASQQLTGINGVFYYSSAIFSKAGLRSAAAITLVPALANILFVGVTIKLVDRMGRRKLMLIGLAGMCISHILLTCGFCFEEGWYSTKSGANWTSAMTISGSLGVVIFFSVGPGPIPWMIVNELFPQSSRAIAYSFAGVVNWTCNYLIGQFFLVILEGAHPYGFLVFAGTSFLFLLAIYVFQPETKGKEIEEIDAFFIRKASEGASGWACCLAPGREEIV